MSDYRCSGRPGLTESKSMAKCNTPLVMAIAAATSFEELKTAAQGLFELPVGSVERERAYLEVFLATERLNGNRGRIYPKVEKPQLPVAYGNIAWY